MEQYDAKQNKQRKDIDGGTCTILANALIKLDTRKIKDGRGPLLWKYIGPFVPRNYLTEKSLISPRLCAFNVIV